MRLNILNKTGLLTDSDRKQPLEHGCEYFTFKTSIDLSEPIKMIPYGNIKVCSLKQYSEDIANFISWWTSNIMDDLNGFSGFHNCEFVLIDCVIESSNKEYTSEEKSLWFDEKS